MSLPKRIYELGKAIANSDLVVTKIASYENMQAFQHLLNQSFPVDEKEAAQRELVRSMYYCNPFGFLQYISVSRNRVKALILWTESKRIARFFDLNRCVHISWSEETGAYTVVPYIPREYADQPAKPAPVETQTTTERPKTTRRVVSIQKKVPNSKTYADAVQNAPVEIKQEWADAL
jgi:hypothetical protein